MKKNKSAFTLAEMMVVLLILTIVLAASMPILTKRVRVKSGGGAEIWKYTSDGTNIYYGQADTQGVIVGSDKVPTDTGLSTGNAYLAKLYLNTENASTNQIVFANNGQYLGHLRMYNKYAYTLPSLELGKGANADASSIAIGNASVLSENSISIGSNAICMGYYSVVVGRNVFSNRESSVVIGDSSTAYSPKTIAIGSNAKCSSKNSIAIGAASYTSVYGNSAIAMGNAAYADSRGIGIGNWAAAEEVSSIAIGNRATATSSIAIGNRAKASTSSIAIGDGAVVSVNSGYVGRSIAMGYNANATGDGTIAIGTSTNADGTVPGGGTYRSTTAIGQSATAIQGGIALGGKTLANYSSVAIGIGANAYGDCSIAIGMLTKATAYGHIQLGNESYHSTFSAPALTAFSDKRIKNPKGYVKKALDIVRKVKITRYTLKADKTNKMRIGVFAQDVQKILPDAVLKGSDGMLSVYYDQIFSLGIVAIQELDEMVQDIQKRILTLENQISAILKVENLHERRLNNLERKNKELESRIRKLEAKK